MSTVLTGPLYGLYARRLRGRLRDSAPPRHVGVIIDGNRRWARLAGLGNPSEGHRHGAEHIDDLLHWCESAGITHATVFVCSTENLARRAGNEVASLMNLVEDLAAGCRTNRVHAGRCTSPASSMCCRPPPRAR